MLDVFIMGIIVVTAAGSAYSQQGRDSSVMLAAASRKTPDGVKAILSSSVLLSSEFAT